MAMLLAAAKFTYLRQAVVVFDGVKDLRTDGWTEKVLSSNLRIGVTDDNLNVMFWEFSIGLVKAFVKRKTAKITVYL